MIILTAGNYRFKRMVKTSVKQAKKFGYNPVVYDLGGLGFGKPFFVSDPSFREKGYYWTTEDGRRSTGMHKIALIRECLSTTCDFVAYLDGDAILVDRIDEVAGNYDIGLTVRMQEEVEETHRRTKGTHRIYAGYINAGVMLFNNNKNTRHFIGIWERESQKFGGDDQHALNSLLQEHFPLIHDRTITVDNVKIRTFDTRIYNYYYFDRHKYAYADIKDADIRKARILHFKNDRKEHYEAMFRPFFFCCKKIFKYMKGMWTFCKAVCARFKVK